MYYAKNLLEVKAIEEDFKGFGVLVNQANDNLQTPGLADQLLKIKDQYECIIKLVETMESAVYFIHSFILFILDLHNNSQSMVTH